MPEVSRIVSKGLAVCVLVAVARSGVAVAGVAPEVSRVIFPARSVEESVRVFNINKYPVLVQAWVDDGEITASPQQAKGPLIVLPPIFRMGPGDQTSLRLINTGAHLPGDRESLFWLNLYEIPSTPKDRPSNDQTVTVTMRTQIKVFIRPDALPYSSAELPKRLAFSLTRQGEKLALVIENPSPFHATLGALKVTIADASQQTQPDMLAPFSHSTVALDSLRANAGDNARVEFSVIGDDGNSVIDSRDLVLQSGDGLHAPRAGSNPEPSQSPASNPAP